MTTPAERRSTADDALAGASTRSKIVFAVVVAASVVGAAAFAVHAFLRTGAAAASSAAIVSTRMDALPSSPGASGPSLMFRSTALGDSFGRVGLARLDAAGEPRQVSSLQCDRVHFAAGTGICLEAKRFGFASYHAHVFDDTFAIRSSHVLAGSPSRARMSRDGRLAAFTVFVSGHSYDSPGFSTRTSVLDTTTGRFVVEDLETFTVTRDGAVIKKADFNFWGFTFAADHRHFYASLGSGGAVHLVKGDLASRQMQVIHEHVECPSLSPDETRVAFKRRAAMDERGRRIWRLHVMDLASRRETLLDQEVRNVDDQVEWLGNSAIAYALPADEQGSAATNVWAMAVDAASPPRLLLPLAFSPTAIAAAR